MRLYLPKSASQIQRGKHACTSEESSASATKDIGKLFTLVTLLTLRKSTQNLYDPSFFFTKTSGYTLYGLCLISIASPVLMTCCTRDVLTNWSPGFATKDSLCYAQRRLWIYDNAVWISEFRSQFSKTYGSYFERLEYRFALIYIYDIIIFFKPVDEHLVHLEEVFRRLCDANVKLNPKKCSFIKQRLEYLGHVVTPEGISPNPDKVRVIQEFSTPKKLKELRSFLGFA